jgi:ketosteroid isomerase-like protein
MSQESMEIVRRSWQAYEEGGLDALLDFFDVNVNWRAIEGALDDVGEINGVEAMRRYLSDWLDTFDNLTSVPTELRDLDNGRILAAMKVNGRAQLSGVETELSYPVIYTVQDGKIVRGREYEDTAAALEAVGLEK